MKFSIIIPVYNVAPYLRATIESVIAQDFLDWEAICVDDGSPDDSALILDEYAARDPRIRVIHKKNGGVSSARNAGIESAKGEWLLFLDGDDLLSPYICSSLASAIAKYPKVDLFKFGFVAFVDGDHFESEKGDAQIQCVDISKQIDFEDVFVYMWQFAYRRTMVDGLRFNLTYHRMEDRPFICDCLFNRNAFFVDIGCVGLGYRQREGSAMHKVTATHVWDGEIRYRIELIKMLDASNKRVDGFVASQWIGGFFGLECLLGFRGRSKGDREMLECKWRSAVAFLVKRPEISFFRRSKYVFLLLFSYLPSSVFDALLRPLQYAYRLLFRWGGE